MRLVIIMALLVTGEVFADEYAMGVSQLEQVTKGLVAYWPMNDTNDVWSTNNGTATAGMVFKYDAGVVGSGADFTAGDDYIEIGNLRNMVSLTADGSISLWYRGKQSSEREMLYNHYTLVAQERFFLLKQADNTFRAGMGDTFDDSIATVTNDLWYHIVKTWNGTSYKVYANKAEIIAGDYDPDDITTDDFDFGYARQSIDRYLDSVMDEIRIYNRVLSLDEIKQLYRMGATPRGIHE